MGVRRRRPKPTRRGCARDEMAFFERSSPSERRSRAASTQSVADLEQNRPTFPRLQQSAVIILGQPPRLSLTDRRKCFICPWQSHLSQVNSFKLHIGLVVERGMCPISSARIKNVDDGSVNEDMAHSGRSCDFVSVSCSGDTYVVE